MKRIGLLVLTAIFMTGLGIPGDRTEITVKTMPPSVIKTIPQAGDTNVDPFLNEIRVTFSKNMMIDRMWSWCHQSPETFPDADIENIHFLKDNRTCVLPVTLKPGKCYVIWINSQKFHSFKDTENKSAVPYLLVFQTKK